MLISFFETVRKYQVPVTIREHLDLLRLLDARVISGSLDDFYAIARMALVKNEAHFDRFDRAFQDYFKGLETLDELFGEIPEDWLRREAEKHLTDEEKAAIEAAGGFDELMKRLKERLENQDKRHQGGNKNIGTAGTSPFGAYGYNPEGIRIGQDESRHRRAVKVWDQRQYKDLDASKELGARNMKVALRRLRQFARQGSPDELDLDQTINNTAQNAGYLDIVMRPEQQNAVKVLMLFDIGGSMDDHIRGVEELFSAARMEFKRLEYYYFHNCLYDFVWKNNRRRHAERLNTWDLLNGFTDDWKIIFVGDATMGPYEITHPGGSVEYYNAEAGAVWMRRLTDRFSKVAWLNPQPETHWGWHQSISLMNQLVEGRMYPLTVDGLTRAMRGLQQ